MPSRVGRGGEGFLDLLLGRDELDLHIRERELGRPRPSPASTQSPRWQAWPSETSRGPSPGIFRNERWARAASAPSPIPDPPRIPAHQASPLRRSTCEGSITGRRRNPTLVSAGLIRVLGRSTSGNHRRTRARKSSRPTDSSRGLTSLIHLAVGFAGTGRLAGDEQGVQARRRSRPSLRGRPERRRTRPRRVRSGQTGPRRGASPIGPRPSGTRRSSRRRGTI